MAVKFSHQLFGAFVMFLVLQSFVAMSTPIDAESLQNLGQAQKGDIVNRIDKVKRFLNTFGYYPDHDSDQFDEQFDDSLESAIKAYQGYFKLKVTGKVDPETIKSMMTPRCGLPDVNPQRTHNVTEDAQGRNHSMLHFVDNYVIFNGRPRWYNMPITYSFLQGQYPGDLNIVRKEVAQAFQSWASVSPLTFSENLNLGNRANIKITFAPLDGPSNTLGYAYSAPVGTLTFDSAEKWTTNPTTRDDVDLQSVAVHEIGHNLGLDHSQDINAIMYPQYPGGIKRNLGRDDVAGLRDLYNY